MKRDINKAIDSVKELNRQIKELESKRNKEIDNIQNDFGLTYGELLSIWGS